jgi:hypothetical protein
VARPAWRTAKGGDFTLKTGLLFAEPPQKLLQDISGKVARIELEDSGTPHGASGDQPIRLKALKRLLDSGQRRS